MCCLFGLLDYNNVFSGKEKNAILSVLSTECEDRGTDATGISYNANDRLCVYKRAMPAHKMHYTVPSAVQYIMGHTRITTQGSEKRNYNNHPFIGSVQSGKFALAHNGILHNDFRLRKSENLPLTRIQTDSYIAVQLIEKQNALNFESLKYMAEKVEGSFTFTVLDSRDNLYIIKGDNPFCLYHYLKPGFYLYASTEVILKRVVTMLCIQDWPKENPLISCGDILKIDRRGRITKGSFNTAELGNGRMFRGFANRRKLDPQISVKENRYLEDLKSVAFYYGYSPDEIDSLQQDGFSCEEIEELLYAECFDLY